MEECPSTRDHENGDSRRARIETRHGDTITTKRIARSLVPDNTDEMETTVEGDCLVTEIARETTGGLHATVDDYLVNLRVAAQLSTEDAESSTNLQQTHE